MTPLCNYCLVYGWISGKYEICYSMKNLFRHFITHLKWTPFFSMFSTKQNVICHRDCKRTIFLNRCHFSYDYCIPLWITSVGGKKKSSLNVQNLVPEIHCVQEIIGHSSPSVPDSNTSSSFEKKCWDLWRGYYVIIDIHFHIKTSMQQYQ